DGAVRIRNPRIEGKPVQSFSQMNGASCKNFVALLQLDIAGGIELAIDVHLNGELLVGCYRGRRQNGFNPRIAADTAFERICINVSVLTLQAGKSGGNIAAVFIAVG